ncbi:MAG TPA: radical SAM protein [bacterium]|nr:radical SAM protein [bacterium]
MKTCLLIRTGIFDDINSTFNSLKTSGFEKFYFLESDLDNRFKYDVPIEKKYVYNYSILNFWKIIFDLRNKNFYEIIIMFTGNRIHFSFGLLIAVLISILKKTSLKYVNSVGKLIETGKINAIKIAAGKLFSLKTLNYLLVVFSSKFKLSRNLGMPVETILETAAICNLRCPFCPEGRLEQKRKRGFMTMDDFKKIMSEAAPYLWYANLDLMGEPLLNKDLPEMIKFTKNLGVEYVEISSNGNHILNDEDAERIVKSGLNKMIISIDAADQDVYEKYRVGGKVNKIIDFTTAIVKAKKKLNSEHPRLDFQIVVSQQNINQIEKVDELKKKIGGDNLKIKPMSFLIANISGNEVKDFITSVQENRYTFTDEKIAPQKAILNCAPIYFILNISWDGDIIPCCSDTYFEMKIGNAIKEKSIKNVWNGKVFKNFRKKVNTDRNSIPACVRLCGKL